MQNSENIFNNPDNYWKIHKKVLESELNKLDNTEYQLVISEPQNPWVERFNLKIKEIVAAMLGPTEATIE